MRGVWRIHVTIATSDGNKVGNAVKGASNGCLGREFAAADVGEAGVPRPNPKEESE